MDDALRATLEKVTTATLTTVLFRHGIKSAWIKHARPFSAGGRRVVGPAFTLRFIPSREDVATPAAWSAPNSTRGAIEDMPDGCVAVVDAMGNDDAGIFGDILCARMKVRGVAGLVTDGVMRDAAGVRATGLDVWCKGIAAPASVAAIHFVGWQEPIGCGGVAVFPGDIVVADDDGAVIVPAAMAADIAAEAAEQELKEAWIISEVERGEKLPGLYPMNEATEARYKAYLSEKGSR